MNSYHTQCVSSPTNSIVGLSTYIILIILISMSGPGSICRGQGIGMGGVVRLSPAILNIVAIS